MKFNQEFAYTVSSRMGGLKRNPSLNGKLRMVHRHNKERI